MPGPKMIGAGARAGHRMQEEASGQILHPGDKMYHGRIGLAPPEEQAKIKELWGQAHEQARRAQRQHDSDEQFHSRTTRDFAAITGATAAGSLGLGYAGRKIFQRDNRKLERRLQRRSAVRKWDENEPFMITSDRRDNGPHKVSTLNVKPKLDRHFSRRARFGRHLLTERGAITGTAVLTGASLAGVPLIRKPAKRNEKLREQLERRKVHKALVSKEWPNRNMSPEGRKHREEWLLGDFAPGRRGTWQGSRGYSRQGRADHAARLNLGDDPALRERARKIVNAKARPKRIRVIFKALRDPQKAYEGHVKGARAKGEKPLSYEAFVARAEGTGAKQAQREAETAAQRESRQHQIIPETHPWRGKPLRETFHSHVHAGSLRNAAISTGIAGSALAGLAYSNRKQHTAKRDTRRDVNTGLGAVTGVAAMDAANTIGGQGAKAVLKERRNRRGVTPHEQTVWGEHKRKTLGLAPGQPVPADDRISQSAKAKAFMHYPKDLPDWRAHRLLAVKNTKAWTAGSLATAGLAGAALARRHTEPVTKSEFSELPRAARRAAKRNLPRLTPEEIAARRAEAAGRRGEAKEHGPKPKAPKPPETSVPHVRPRSSFLGRGQVRDLAIGVPLGAGALYYGTRRPAHQGSKGENFAKADRRQLTHTAAGAVGGAALLDAADTLTGASLKRVGANQRDRARRTMTSEQRTQMNRDINAHGQRFGFVDERGRGRAPKPADPHRLKHDFYRSYPKHLPGARVARLNALRDRKTGPIMATGAVLGGALAARQQHVSKLSHSQVGLLTGSGTLGTLIGAQGTRRQNESHEATGALAGGWAGQGLYQAAGYGPRKLVRGIHSSKVPIHERDVPKSQMRTPEERKAYDAFRRQRRAQRRKYPNQVDYKRHTPKNWHGWRTERVIAHTHGGRLGTALGTAATAGGIGLGVRQAQRYDAKHNIGKAQFGYEERKRSYPRTVEMLAGLGLLGYGVPRLKMLGPAAQKGIKLADKHGAGKEARAAYELARSFGQTAREVTGRGEMKARQIRQIDNAVTMIPKGLRGEVATAAGALLAAHAHPTTRERFTAVQ